MVLAKKTKSSLSHGGAGWEFGSCLWSPTTDKSGKKIYKNMTAASDARISPLLSSVRGMRLLIA
jgi:hypothetical protein